MSRIVDIRHDSSRGFTLVELIVAMAIFTIIMGGVMVMFNTVTSAVRRGYRTMDLFDATHGALLTVERDIQSAFSAPATGADFHFYGEPNGFVFVGIAPDGKLGRLTYAVHVDTSRLSYRYDINLKKNIYTGENITLPLKRADMEARCSDFSTYYPGTDPYLNVEVEVIFGVLTRYFESDVNQVTRFPKLEIFAEQKNNMPQLPMPNYLKNLGMLETTYRSNGLPWIFNNFKNNLNFWEPLDTSVPWDIKDKIGVIETCHYWLQMLNGNLISPVGDKAHPMSITRPNFIVIPTGSLPWLSYFWDDMDQFWYDHYPFKSLSNEALSLLGFPAGFENYPNSFLFATTSGKEERPFLWDYVVARDFIVDAYLLDPSTGLRILDPPGDSNGVPISVFTEDELPPIFQYAVEDGLFTGAKVENFNTLFNLNFTDDVDGDNDLDGANAFDALMYTMANNPANIELISDAVEEMTASHQFYDLGDPIQSRLPSAFDINLFVISPPVTTSAPPDVFKFSQTIHIPSGFLRRSLSVD